MASLKHHIDDMKAPDNSGCADHATEVIALFGAVSASRVHAGTEAWFAPRAGSGRSSNEIR